MGIRTFNPKRGKKPKLTARQSRIFTANHYGEEPRYPPGSELTRAQHGAFMNWHNAVTSKEDALDMVFNHYEAVDPDTASYLRAVNPKMIPSTLGWNCRLLDLGYHLSDSSHEYMTRTVRWLVDNFTQVDEETAEVVPRANTQAQALYSDFVNRIDQCIDDREFDFDLSGYIRSFRVPKYMVERVLPRVQELQVEYQGAAAGRLDGYKRHDRAELRALSEMLLGFVEDFDEFLGQKTRTVKKPRSASREKKVADIKYCVKDSRLGLTSVDPKELLGARFAVFADVRYEEIKVYESESGIEIRGSAMVGLDPSRCLCKKVKKVLPDVARSIFSGNVARARKIWSELSGPAKPVNDRINRNMLLIKVSQ